MPLKIIRIKDLEREKFTNERSKYSLSYFSIRSLSSSGRTIDACALKFITRLKKSIPLVKEFKLYLRFFLLLNGISHLFEILCFLINDRFMKHNFEINQLSKLRPFTVKPLAAF